MTVAVLLLIMTLLLCSADADGIRIEATAGQEVLLPCDASRYNPIKTVEWSRPDIKEYVIFCPNQKSDPVVPETHYEGRVGLVNRINGNMSMKLLNVTTDDAGTYECYVQGGTGRTKRAIKLINTVNLHVAPASPAGNKDEQKGGGGNEDRRPEDGGSKDGAREEGGDEDGLGVGRGRVMFVFAGLSFVVFMGLIVTAVISQKKMKNSKSSPPDDAEKPPLI